MAATVGATLSGVTFSPRHTGLGPFISSGGNVYFFGRDSVNTGTVEPHKASDPMSAFTAQTAKLMSSGNTTAIEAMACYQVGQVIHVVTQISTAQTYYNSYTMDTDAWTLTTSETAVAAAAFAPTTNATFVSLVVRSGGEVVICYNAGLTAMASGFNMVRYTRRTGTATYSAPVNIDNGGSVNWGAGSAVLGASGRVHFFFRSSTASDAYQRTLSAANALETFPSAFDADIFSNVGMYGPGFAYNDGTATRVQVPFMDADNVGGNIFASIARFDSADAPSVTIDQYVSDNSYRAASTGTLYLVNDAANRHLLYIRATPLDLYHADATIPSGAFSADTNELAAGLNSISANVYTRSGTKYLAMVLDDASTIKYAEITLATPTSLVFEPNRTLRMLTLR